jgi:hypothetical protein
VNEKRLVDVAFDRIPKDIPTPNVPLRKRQFVCQGGRAHRLRNPLFICLTAYSGERQVEPCCG